MNERGAADVVLFAPHLGGGGAERVLLNLASGFQARGLIVDVVLVDATGAFIGHLPPGTRVVDLAASSALRSIPAFARYLRTHRPRAVLSVLGHANVSAIVARALSGVKCVLAVSIHHTVSQAIESESLKTRLLSYVERLTYPFADARVAVSRGVQEDFARTTGLPASSLRVIYNPVVGPALFAAAAQANVHPWLLDRSIPTLVAVGRLSSKKDYPTLFKAVSIIRRERQIRLIVLGEGPEREHLETLRRELGLEESIDMPGFVANPYSFVARANLFALSSHTEGLPTVLIEALALGTRVVATDCPSGPREILDHGRYGALVPVGDPSALASAVLSSLTMGKTAANVYEAVRPYEFDTVIPQYLDALLL